MLGDQGCQCVSPCAVCAMSRLWAVGVTTESRPSAVIVTIKNRLWVVYAITV